jgi:phage shock protein A
MSRALGALVRRLRGPRREPSPREVYDRVLEDRQATYAELRDAVAGLIYLRRRLEGDITERRAEIARLHAEAREWARRGSDSRALVLLEEKQRLAGELAESEEQLAHARRSVDEATQCLMRFGASIRALEREKRESLSALGASELRQRVDRVQDRETRDRDTLAEIRQQAARARESNMVSLAMRSLDDGIDDTSARLELAALKRR